MKKHIINIASFLLILLWSYAAISKLAEFSRSQLEMQNQIFTKPVAIFLSYAVPVTELLLAILLSFERSRLAGLIGSSLLMAAFTAYIALVMAGAFHRYPCSCGGVLKNMSWQAHLIFNLAFLSAAMAGIAAQRYLLKERRTGHK